MSADLAARRLILIDRIVRLSPKKIAEAEQALDEIDVGSEPEEDGRALYAVCAYGLEPWDDVHRSVRDLYRERARRLRKRWGCVGANELAEARRLLKCADEATEAARASERNTLLAWERACNERDAALKTIDAAAESYAFASDALEILRERASRVVDYFEQHGPKHVGAAIQDLRQALGIFR